jgi:hypothetical protein
MIKNSFIISTLLIGIFAFSQSKSAPTLKEIQKTFKGGKYSTTLLNNFRKEMNYDGDAEYLVDEEIPGEIISFSEQPTAGVSSSRTTTMFIIKNGKLKTLHYIPVDENYKIDKIFKSKVEKYAGKDWDFAYNSGFDISKNKNNEYIISTIIKKNGEGDCCPSQYFEYSTKDFKNFKPYRISNDGKKWKIIK